MNNIRVIESQSSISRKQNGMKLKLACSDQKRSKLRERPPLLDVVAEKILTELPNACLIPMIKTELLNNICVCFSRTNIYEECLFLKKKFSALVKSIMQLPIKRLTVAQCSTDFCNRIHLAMFTDHCTYHI